MEHSASHAAEAPVAHLATETLPFEFDYPAAWTVVFRESPWEAWRGLANIHFRNWDEALYVDLLYGPIASWKQLEGPDQIPSGHTRVPTDRALRGPRGESIEVLVAQARLLPGLLGLGVGLSIPLGIAAAGLRHERWQEVPLPMALGAAVLAGFFLSALVNGKQITSGPYFKHLFEHDGIRYLLTSSREQQKYIDLILDTLRFK